jgi:[ribosomal protein S5]-alanine N-acetyltransferase
VSAIDMDHSETPAELPTFLTPRLRLRPFRASDAPDVQRLAGEREIAANTMLIPHPYEDGVAETWIETHGSRFAAGTSLTLAIELRESNILVGAIGLEFQESDRNAELGYWIGRPFWNRGFCTEAARAMLSYGFRERDLYRIHAKHYRRNFSSGRVMEKIGMRREGLLRGHILKWGRFEDVEVWGILESEFRDPD